jgi:hypothetical protein
VRELHPSCTTQVYGTMQALYLAQVCSHTHITLWLPPPRGPAPPPRGYWLGCQGCATGVARAVEVSTSLQQRPCDLNWPNVCSLPARQALQRSSTPRHREGRECVPHDCGAVRLCTCHGFEQGGVKRDVPANPLWLTWGKGSFADDFVSFACSILPSRWTAVHIGLSPVHDPSLAPPTGLGKTATFITL